MSSSAPADVSQLLEDAEGFPGSQVQLHLGPTLRCSLSLPLSPLLLAALACKSSGSCDASQHDLVQMAEG